MWDWTDSDRQIAERFQLARLMNVIPELLQTVLLVDLDYTLHIHCEDLAVINSLLANLEAVQLHVYIVLGCREISFWSDKKLIACHMLGLQSAVDTCNDDDEVIDMATATAEKQSQSAAVTPPKPSTQVDKLPGQTLAAIAEDTEQSIDDIRAWIAEHDWAIIPFNGEEIVAGIAAIAAIDHFTAVLMQQRKAKRGLQVGNLPAIESNGATATAEPEPVASTEPEAKPEKNRSPRLTMVLPRGYSNKVSKATRASLDRALPTKPEQRQEYLEQIVSETDRGKAFLSSIAELMSRKFGSDKAKAQTNLLEMAKKMQGELSKAK